MDYPSLYRRRIIPDECILLKDDVILSYENDILVTKWNALKPKVDLHHGYSCYFFREGCKVSKFYRADGTLLYYYCDIIEHEVREADNSIVITDLLADVIVYPDGFVKVVDLNELAEALEAGTLNTTQLQKSLLSLNRLLELIYAGRFSELTDRITPYES
ncbi:MAG: DUF402 domain-containing protein [Lachnospiraceae bacterium]|nr:DUF402 domain-containing protein [Lachnospiraceae bacterium]